MENSLSVNALTWITFHGTLSNSINDFSDPYRLFDALRGIGQSSVSFKFIFLYITFILPCSFKKKTVKALRALEARAS